jgi:hypothetical protein
MPKVTINLRNLEPDYRTMVSIERDLLRDVGLGVEEMANVLVSQIRGSWSLNSPSSVGSPPAIVTGNLDSSVVAEPTGRDDKGRFADKENTTVMFVRVDTSEGMIPEDRGNYAPVLEEKLERPFIEPAIEVVAPMIGAIMKRRINI